MSGIAGLLSLEGEPVTDARIRPMIDRLAHRGADHVATWPGRTIGLAQCTRWTTPESSCVSLPLTDAAAQLTMVADARIDNRDDLIRLLGARATISDEELILLAYARWGAETPEKLLGDFSFAIWDEANQRLFCARDFAGVRPFYYAHIGGKFFAFGSEIKALLAEPAVPREINDERVADFLCHITYDNAYTFYRHIERLPAGHSLTVSDRGLQVDRYFSYDASHELPLESDQAYADAFRETFAAAVTSRLRSRGPVAATLSGGLDSSAIAAVATNIAGVAGGPPIHTFSAVFDAVTDCDEREYIHDLLQHIQVEPHFFPGDQHHPIGDLGNMIAQQDEPVTAPNASMLWQLYGRIGGSGFNVLLDGHGGDEVVSYGYGYLMELALARRWFELIGELKSLPADGDRSLGRTLAGLVYNASKIRASRSLLSRVQRRTLGAVLRRSSPIDSGKTYANPVHLLSSDFRNRTKIDERLKAWRRVHGARAASERERHIRVLSDPFQQLALETLDRQGAAHDVDVRFPFWDRRLVEFCVSLPSNQKLRGGRDRHILRSSMEGLLPASIQWRQGKTDFTPNLLHGVRSNDGHLIDSMCDAVLHSSDVVDKDAFGAVLRDFKANPAAAIETSVLLNLFSFATWQNKDY